MSLHSHSFVGLAGIFTVEDDVLRKQIGIEAFLYLVYLKYICLYFLFGMI